MPRFLSIYNHRRGNLAAFAPLFMPKRAATDAPLEANKAFVGGQRGIKWLAINASSHGGGGRFRRKRKSIRGYFTNIQRLNEIAAGIAYLRPKIALNEKSPEIGALNVKKSACL